MQEISERVFHAYVSPLYNVMAFNYLGRATTSEYDNWTAVASNLQKARNSWGHMLRTLSWEGGDPKVLGKLFKAVVHAVLIFGVEMWVLTPRMERYLCRFQHRVVRRLTGRQPRRRGGGELGLSSAGGGNVGSGL